MLSGFMEYFSRNGEGYFRLLIGHIGISILSVFLAMLLAVPLGILCAKHKWLQILSERLFGLLRIIPSLAILLILIPVMGTGVKPSVVALTILAIPPILMNTIQAFLNLPGDIIEAATAMGMAQGYLLWKVKLPLAFPLMYAGIRTATVEVIASATIASYIGAGGLGDIIFTGLSLLRMEYLVIGGGSVALLSLTAGFLLDSIYRYQTRYLKTIGNEK